MVTQADLDSGLIGHITANSIAGAKLGQESYQAQKERDAKLAQLIKGKEMDLSNAKAEADDAQGRVDARPGQHITAKVGNASYGESMVDPSVRADKTSASEAKALKSLADKTVGTLHGQTDALETLKNAVDNPSSVNDQQLQTGLARLSEGPGQRLLHTIVEQAGITPTGAGDLVGIQNWIRGGGMSKLQPGQKQAIADSLQQHTALLNQQFKDQSAIYNGQAPLIAPHLGPDTHRAMFDSYATPFQGSLQRLTPQQRPQVDPNVAAQATGTAGAKAGIVDKLAAFLSPNRGQGAPAAPQAGGSQPPSFEQWKAMKAQQGR